MVHLLRCGLVLTVLALTPSSAVAQNAPWCFSETGSRGTGAQTCGFYSFAQCLAYQRGIGGFCAPNPFSYRAPYRADARIHQRKRRR
jgi:hypothetical protein